MNSADISLAEKNRSVDPKSWQTFQEKNIEPKIRNEAGANGIGYSANQEFAILRKAVKSIYDIVATIHPEVYYNDEYIKFMTYFETVKSIVEDFEYKISK